MNAVTEAESNAIATLPPAARAALALGSTKTETALRELIKASASIVSVTNKAGREECHTAYMKLKNSRVAVGHTAADATEDAKKFTAAVKTEAARLVEIISAEETRLQLLRDGFDAIEEKRKADELAAEMARVALISEHIEDIRRISLDVAGKDSATIKAALDQVDEITGTESVFGEEIYQAQAITVRNAAFAKLTEMHTAALAAEAAEAQRLADIAAADQRRADEAAENARVAAENQRIAAENAAAAQKLADQQAAMDLAARQQREQAEAAAKAEDSRRAEVARREQVERDRAATEAQAKIDAELAKLAAARQTLADEQAAAEQRKADALAAEQMAARVLIDHTEALLIDQEFDDHAAVEVARAVEVTPAPVAVTSVPTDLADAADEIYDDVSYLRDLADNSKLDVLTMISALELIDFAAARAALAAEPA